MPKSLIDATGEAFPEGMRPGRIVSLVPSLTESVFELGSGNGVVGRTRFCVSPDGEALRRVPAVGGTKNPDIERIRRLAPDLVLANKEENRREDVEAIREFAPVFVTDVPALAQALQMVLELGRLLGTGEALRLSRGIIDVARNDLSKISELLVNRPPFTFAYLIWMDPFMAAGRGCFIDSMLSTIGGRNAVHSPRYPELSREALSGLDPDWVFLSTEPYPFREKHIALLEEELAGSRAASEGRICLVDGQACSWYGTRLASSIKYLEQFRHFLDS